MTSKYTLQHTAEAIDYKLNLIDKNKNLLPYPYKTNLTNEALPDGFEDVGDGSLLTHTPVGATETRFLLNTCQLPAGNYFVSLNITNMLEEAVIASDFGLEVTTEDNKYLASALANEASYPGGPLIRSDLLILESETAIKVYLNVPTSFDANLLIKPQIEEGTEKTDWVPNMDKIGTYVDRRFNGTNVKFRRIFELMDCIEIIETETV